MPKSAFNWVITAAMALSVPSEAQVDSVHLVKDSLPHRHRIAVFTPLYLDSAYDKDNNYRYGKQFPKFINPGLEFWEGVQLAIDSLNKENMDIDIHVYDTRSENPSLTDLLKSKELDSPDLFIGEVSAYEARLLANEAARRNIDFINANFPNDAGVTLNPRYIILNSTLLTHCAGIYRFMQSNYSLSPIVMFTKKGQQEDRLREYLDSAATGSSSIPLKLNTVLLPDNHTLNDVSKQLDSNRTYVCLIGSLDIAFAQQICREMASLSSSYHTVLVGMPTWDMIDFTRPEYKGLEVVYSTPFYYNPADPLVNNIQEYFRINFYSRPSDMVFRGYETIYHFAHKMISRQKDSISAYPHKPFRVFNDFDIKPVWDKGRTEISYFENKKLYFIRKLDGQVKAVY